MIDFEAFRRAALARDPFDHLIVPAFLHAESLGAAVADFPRVERGGSFPVSVLSFGPGFSRLLTELRGDELRAAVAEKFGIPLEGRPTMVTVRGRARPRDGRIHTDSRSKIVTLLLYMNPAWAAPGGWLRLLRSSGSLDDFFAEVPPEAGTAVFFRCTENAWHGHTPFAGERRAVQLNWVTDESVVRHEERRHRFSALWKKLLPA